MIRSFVVTACAALAPAWAAATTPVVRVACDGRAVSAVPGIGNGARFDIELAGCTERQSMEVRFRFRERVDDYFPAAVAAECPPVPSAATIGPEYACPLPAAPHVRRLTLQPPAGTRFVSYSAVVDGAVRKLGWLVVGDDRKLVSYALRSRPEAARPFHLERLGDYPVITDKDRLYALIVDATKDQLHFDLTFRVEKGEIANPAPIRPSFSPVELASRPPPPDPDKPPPPPPFEDLLLPIGDRFRGGDVVKVTIAAEMKVVTKDAETEKDDDAPVREIVRERQIVKLLDDVAFPQVHTRYAYNFSFGLVASGLRQPTYTKVQTHTGAEPADNRYRTETAEGSLDVAPVAALSFYLRKVDIQVPLTWKDRVIPAPTLGFSLTDPTEDLFLGFTHELVRNAHLFWGWHWGKIDVPAAEGPLEDRSSTVTTVKRSDNGFFLGITLNLGGIKDIIVR